ncbi:hypothetical protein, partial [Rhodococcus ruber]
MAAMITEMRTADPEASELKIRSPGLVSGLLSPRAGVVIVASGMLPCGPPAPDPASSPDPEVRGADLVGASLICARNLSLLVIDGTVRGAHR